MDKNKKDPKTKKSKTEEPKPELKDFQKIDVESPEDMQKLLDSLLGSGGNDKKVKKIGLVNRLFPNIFVNLLFYILFIALITFALQGYLHLFKYDEIYKLVIFIVAFGIIDTLGRDLLYSKIPFVVITSFGLVILLLTVLSSIGLVYIIPGLEIDNIGMYAIYLLILMVFRLIITNYLSPKVHRYVSQKRRNKNKK